jgi:rhamnosyltransferase
VTKIFSILVAYNPKIDEIKEAIEILKGQTEMVVVCNNSAYDISLDDEKVKVFNFGKNLGIGAAQSIGMKWAFEHEADFILQMDQDSIPNFDMVAQLLSCYFYLQNRGYNIGLVGPIDFDKDSKVLNKDWIKKGNRLDSPNYVFVDQTLSSGSLIPKKAYETIGGMEDKLFIDTVDFEYCWRLKKNGFLVTKSNEALLAHKLGDGKEKILGFLNVNVTSPIRHYYQFRNVLLLIQRGYVPAYWRISNMLKMIIKLFIYPFVLSHGKDRFKYMLKGIKDGLLSKCGKISE